MRMRPRGGWSYIWHHRICSVGGARATKRTAARAAHDLGVLRITNALSYIFGDEIPKIDAPSTGEEILKRLTQYARKRREAAVTA